jgi:hypothetical protein
MLSIRLFVIYVIFILRKQIVPILLFFINIIFETKQHE